VARVVKRTTSTNTENPVSPTWAPANELATHVTQLQFSFYDDTGQLTTADTAELRARILAIEVYVTVEASMPLSSGVRPTYSLSARSSPRNLNLR